MVSESCTHIRLEWYHRIQDSLMCFCKVLLVFVTFLTEFFTVLVVVGYYLLFNNDLMSCLFAQGNHNPFSIVIDEKSRGFRGFFI
ncbi:hypothetical protein VcPa08_01691 [Vibrio cholerae]|nr:hypothetical protein VcPa07_01572 [Vibrio cholerae]GFK58365.1 hypothetical protein VcPa08_01691 [Vibrio cholerae]GFK61914.1 hypothetical protein VcPa09_01691 [Vibrio cholerae]GFK65603.1 hypothetical protein VcPa10_01845 [Vibrio cholerae]GFK68839.1 hypothetical protein VcPa11_01528 [Vibrio cholerae]